MSRHLFVALPSYTGMTWVPSWTGLFYGLWALDGWKVELCPILFEAELAATRSRLAALFLRSGASDLLYVDWDVTFAADAVPRLLRHEEDFVAVDYPRRREPISYAGQLLQIDGHWNVTPNEHGLLEMQEVPAGLLRLKRSVIERMFEAYPELAYEDYELKLKSCLLFQHLIEDGKRYGEDNSFCRRWRKIGGKIYIDPEIQASQWGQKLYAGNYSDWLKLAQSQPVE